MDSAAKDHGTSRKLDARVVLLTHYIPLNQLPIYRYLSAQFREFHVLISTEIEPNRDFEPEWEGLDVTVQNTLTIQQAWKHRSAGFEDELYVHFPLDTLKQLRKLQPDVILSYELGFRSLASLWYRIRHAETRLVLCTYMTTNTEQGRGLLRSLSRKILLRRADAITHNGPESLKFMQSLGVSSSKLF